jgi:hypothetical protein
MLRYIHHYIRSVWYRWFKTEDEHDEMLIIYSFNAHYKIAMYNGHYSSSSSKLNKVVTSFKALKNYILQVTDDQDKKINYYTIAEDMQIRYGPDVPSIKLRMHHFLLMCLDDV